MWVPGGRLLHQCPMHDHGVLEARLVVITEKHEHGDVQARQVSVREGWSCRVHLLQLGHRLPVVLAAIGEISA